MPTEKELRKEYTKYRDIFQKRVKRGIAAGIGKFRPYEQGGYAYMPTLTELSNLSYLKREDQAVFVRDLQMRIGLLKRALEPESELSITAIKKKRKNINQQISKALKMSGYDHISPGMVKKFGLFMEEMRIRYGRKLPKSEEMAEFFSSLRYSVKRRSLSVIVELWEEYEKNGYQFPNNGLDISAK